MAERSDDRRAEDGRPHQRRGQRGRGQHANSQHRNRQRDSNQGSDHRPHRLSPDTPIRMAKNPRLFAERILRRVIDTDAYANLLLPAKLATVQRDAEYAIAPRDIGFITELVYGTLRRQGSYDAIIAQASSRAIAEIDIDVLIVLRMAAHQCFHMRVPNHAMAASSVDLISDIGMGRAKGLVNAVCRRMSERTWDEWVEIITTGATEDDNLAIEYSHPVWIVSALRRALAVDGRSAELTALLEADNTNPVVNLVALPGLASVTDIAELAHSRDDQESADAIDTAPVSPNYSPIGAELPQGINTSTLPAGIRVQDQGSQIVTLALTAATPIAAGEHWADVCAGPGGKAVLLAAVAEKHGATLACNELAPHRAELVSEALSVLPSPPQVHIGDAKDFLAGRSFDRILLDAPCTGLGALRRRPESRWRKHAELVRELMLVQRELLNASFQALKPGGVLAYVTCSPHIAETRNQIQRCLKDNAAARMLDTKAIVHQVNPQIPLGEHPFGVQLWPHAHATDAMFVSLLTKAE